MEWSGIIIGFSAFFIIGIFHPIVIKCEYYFSSKVWPVFLVGGLMCCVASLFVPRIEFSAFLGILGFSMLWSIGELKEQTERVRKGWFPQNPNRRDKTTAPIPCKTTAPNKKDGTP